MSRIDKYGLMWPDGTDEARIEQQMIRKGGLWQEDNKVWYGLGIVEHFKRFWSYLWPDDAQTWWTDLILKEVLANQFTSLVGPASSWKTSTVSRIALMDWICFPECTMIMMSSTTMEGVRARVYGETTKLWRTAHDRYPWIEGHPVDHKCVITYDNVDVDKARDMRNSIVGIPCKTSTGRFVGYGVYSGRKNRRVWCIADEFQFMELAVLDAQDNLISNGPNLVPGIIRERDHWERGKPIRGYKCVFIGNPNPSRPGNPLDIVSEPENGFPSIPEDGKTKVWDCKKLPNHPVKCRCINLDGMDSPNSKYPVDNPRWVNLAGPFNIRTYTEGSESYWSQGRGVFKFGLAVFKIITREVCDQNHAFDEVVWDGDNPTTKIGMCDAAYGGGDRCALGWLEFGKCVDGKVRILMRDYWIIPIVIRKGMTPEDQIAQFTKEKMESVGVPPENFFFDGRGTLATAYGKHWSVNVNALEFGGQPTDRPAGPDLFTTDKSGQRRLKTEREHFSKNVSALWFAWRYATDADQIRGMKLEIVLDAQPREWYKVAGDKIEIESKEEVKKRTGLSPDLADMLVSGLEGARRRGFQIATISDKKQGGPSKPSFIQKHHKDYHKLLESKQVGRELNYR